MLLNEDPHFLLKIVEAKQTNKQTKHALIMRTIPLLQNRVK